MPRSRSIHYYGPAYFGIVRKVGVGMEELSLEFESWQVAKARQGQFYAFVGAVKQALREMGLGKTGLTEEMKQELELLGPFVHKVQAWVHSPARDPLGPKTCLTFRHRTKSDDNQDFERALKQAGGVAPLPLGPAPAQTADEDDPEVAASLARLQAKLNALPKGRADYTALKAELKAAEPGTGAVIPVPGSAGGQTGGGTGAESRYAAHGAPQSILATDRMVSTTSGQKSNGDRPIGERETQESLEVRADHQLICTRCGKPILECECQSL